MNSKALPLVLAMFTLVCALPAVGAAPEAIAQEDIPSGADLAGGIISDVSDGGDEEGNSDAETENDQDATDTPSVNQDQEDNNDILFGDDANTQTAIPITDQDQDQEAANLAAQLAANLGLDAANVDANEEEEVPPECPEGFTLNNNGQCERIVSEDPNCLTGFTFNPETDKCEQRQTQAPT
jgi:hypothetical protein